MGRCKKQNSDRFFPFFVTEVTTVFEYMTLGTE